MSKQAHILVVAGDAHLRRATSRVLKQAGYQVTEAGTGAEGLRLARAREPDLVLLAAALPDMDGVELCQRIKGQAALGDCFVVMLGDGETSSDDRAGGLEAGADGYIARPISNQELLAQVMALLRIKRAQADVAHACEALRESEERFRNIFENAVMGLYRTTPGGEILLANPALVEMLGYESLEELAQRDLETEGYEPSYPRAAFKAHIERHGQVRGWESAWKRRDGSTVHVRESATAVRDAAGNTLYYEGTVEDITDKVRAEEGLRRRAEELATLQATMLDITVEHDLPTLLETIVERAAQLLDTPSGGLYLCDPEREEVRCVVSYNTPDDYTGTVLQYGEGAAGAVAETGEPLVIDDYRTWEGRAAAYEEDQPFTAVLSAPMTWQGQVTGVLHVLQDVASKGFTPADLELLALFANHASIAVENARLYEETHQRATQLEALRRVGLKVAAQLDLDTLLHSIASQAIELLDGVAGGLYLYRPARDGLELVVSVGRGRDPAPLGTILHRGEGLSGKVWVNDGPLIVDDYQHWEGRAPQYEGLSVETVVGVPIRWGEEFLGVLTTDGEASRPFSSADAQLLSLFATQAAIAIRNARLYEQAQQEIAERKRAEAELRESEARYRNIFQTAGVPIWEEDFSEVKTAIDELNTQGVTDFRRYLDDHPEFVAQAAQMINVRDVNQATLNMLGAQNKEEVRDSLDKVFAPETLRIFREELIAIAEGKTYFEGETINRTLEGERRNVLLTMAIPTQAEKLDSVLVSTMDITERKRAEEALRESEKKFRTLIENLIDWVWRVDRDGVYTYVSPQAERIMGYSVSEILGKTPFHFMTSQEAERVGAIFSEITAKRERILGLEDTMVTKEGHEIPFETNATPLFDPNGAFIGYMGTCRDITQRKRAEAEVALASEALRRRNRELATLNRASQALVSILDLDQVLVNVLEEVRGLLSVTASSIWLVDPETDELVCQQATGPQNERVRGWRLAPGQGLAGRAARSGQSMIAPDVRADERHFKGVDRQTGLPLRSILTIPLRIKNSVIGVLQVVDTEVDRFDAGDLKLLEPLATSAAIAIENARLYQQTRRDAETRSALLREVNHRVKNNLTSILGLLYTARDRVQVDERAAYLCTMDALIRRVRGLATAHDLLSASRWAPLRLSDLASRVIHVSLETLSRHKRVSVHVPVSPVRVTADQAHNLALVIGELTTNAAKHALKGRDTACISFQVELEDEDGDDLEHASPMIRCEFRDDGPGYPEEVLALERRNVGFDLIHNIVRKGLRGTLTLHNDGGAVAVIRFEAQVQER